MKRKGILLILLVSYLLVLGINLAGNYEYYAAGNDWRYSVYFVLIITTLGWVGAIAVGPMVEKLLRSKIGPTLKLVASVAILAAYGIFLMVFTMKAMVWLFHFPEQSTNDYLNNTTYSVLFTIVCGLMVCGQQFLVLLKQNAIEKEQMQQEMIRSQYETLKNQVNPHFLFNSLNTLTTMIPKQPELAVKFVEQMSKVFRYSLQNSAENMIVLATELKVVESFLFLNQQRFEGKLNVSVKVDESACNKKIITQSLLMLAENAIKHNEISEQNPLTISIFNEGNYLVIKNELQRKMLLENSTNMGLANIQKRYALASNTPVIIDASNDFFTVKIPLL